MGVGQSIDKQLENYAAPVTEYKPLRSLRSALGVHEVVQDPATGSARILRSLNFDSSAAHKKIVLALKDLQVAAQRPEIALLRAESAQLIDNRMFCSVSNAKIVLEYFPVTLEDAIAGGHVPLFFGNEARLWALLFDLVAAIDFSAHNNSTCAHFVHPRAICWAEEQGSWKLLHSGLALESNLSLALAGSLHFCSPELFARSANRTTSGNGATGVAEDLAAVPAAKSDLFSVALVVLFLVLAGERKMDVARVYDRAAGQVDGFYLQEKVGRMADKGYSELLVRILGDFLQEFEHLRLSSADFFEQLGNYRAQLEDENFRGHRGVFDSYMCMKSSNIFGVSQNRAAIGGTGSFEADGQRKASGHLFGQKGSIDPVRGTPRKE